jgi:hypothetical protein
LPPGYDNYYAMFHGTDERIPLSVLESGMRIMDSFLRDADADGAAELSADRQLGYGATAVVGDPDAIAVDGNRIRVGEVVTAR